MAERYFKQPSTANQAHFSNVPNAEIQRSTFDRSHAYKTTFNAGYLIPTFVDEVLPGDTFNLKQTAFARLATPLKPVMDNMYMDTQFFFVPYRLVWDQWQEFCGERKNPQDDPTLLTIPQGIIDLSTLAGTQYDYFGIPQGTGTVSVSVLPSRAYNLIWNEWYRDENLQDALIFPTDNAPSGGPLELAKRGKRKDYFTSALPWPQKGDAVLLPIGVSAPVIGDPNEYEGQLFTGLNIGGGTAGMELYSTADETFEVNARNPSTGFANTDVLESNMIADLTQATSVSINDLRTAFQIQKLLERDARGGTRYIELILSHFGVTSDDARLQRPELLGTSSSPVNVSPVASTVATQDSPQAELAAVGTTVANAGFSKSFTEHGIIIGLSSVRADLTYQQGIERFWSRQTRYDFYWPALSHLGEQAILNKEIYADGTSNDEEVFGYQERYAEYRYKPSRITGKFSSADPQSLDVWHLSQDFNVLPLLNDSFIQENPPIDRIVAVPSEPQFLCDIWIKLKTTRPMPVYSVPGLVDHF